MRNFERYKTAEERASAFSAHCENTNCEECGVKDKSNGELGCVLGWLDLEAEEEEEKPLPCPFCGGKCVAHDGSKIKPDKHGIKPHSYVECTKCGYRSRTTDDYEHEGICNIINEHNRMVRRLRGNNG